MLQGEFDHEAGVTSLCMHTDGTSIATGTRDGQVITWDSSTNIPLLQLQGKVAVSLWYGRCSFRGVRKLEKQFKKEMHELFFHRIVTLHMLMYANETFHI